MTPTNSIIIRAHNEEKHIGRLLEGISCQTVPGAEVILVDSGSTDRTLEVASRYPVHIVQIQPQDFSFGRSLNIGIAAAQGDLVVIASAHVYPVYPDWLERLIEPFLHDPRVGLTYGRQLGAKTTAFSEHQVFAHWYPDQPQPRQGHPFCNNANAAIRRSLWQQHPYDETLPGLEDLAWARWAFEQGHVITYVPEAEIVHIHSERPRSIYNRYKREGMAFKQIYPQEHFHLSDFLRLFSSNAVADARQALRQKRLSREWRSILQFRWMQFWGTYQGYRRSGPLTWRLKQAFYYPGESLPSPVTPSRSVEPIQYSGKDQIPN